MKSWAKSFAYLGIVLFHSLIISTQAQNTFTNPIFDGRSADPAVLLYKRNYYISLSTQGERQLTLFRSPRLSNFRGSVEAVIYDAKDGESDIWASELHEIDGEVYCYFSMRREDHRVYALKAEDPNNLMGKWSEPIPMMEGWERGGIDGTIMKHGDGKMYWVWVTDGALWVARMNNATSVQDSKLKLRTHVNPWECCQDEGPYFFYNAGVSYLTFSGGDTWDPNYSIGYMTIDGSKDPMVPSNWWFGDEKPVFWRNDEENVYGPGHGGFTTSPDGTELWMIYHAASTPSYTERIARIEKITFDADGKPVFPRPSGPNHPQPVPSGEV